MPTATAPIRLAPSRLFLLAGAVLLAGCASTPRLPESESLALPDGPRIDHAPLPESPATAAVNGPPPVGSAIAMSALAYIGTRYRFGGSTPESGFDCSGFVRWVFRDHLQPDFPRASQAMAQVDAPSVAPTELVSGDLVFFRIRGSRISHVGIYVGDDRFIHAPSRGGAVRIDSLGESYWQRRYAGAKRIIADR